MIEQFSHRYTHKSQRRWVESKPSIWMKELNTNTHTHKMCWKKMFNIFGRFSARSLFVYNVDTNLFIASIAAVHMTAEWVFNKKSQKGFGLNHNLENGVAHYNAKCQCIRTRILYTFLNLNSIRKRAPRKFIAYKGKAPDSIKNRGTQ